MVPKYIVGQKILFFHHFFQIEVHEELADADKISANGSVPTSNSDQDAEDAFFDGKKETGNGNGYQNRNCQEMKLLDNPLPFDKPRSTCLTDCLSGEKMRRP